jgi:hypothetical protein
VLLLTPCQLGKKPNLVDSGAEQVGDVSAKLGGRTNIRRRGLFLWHTVLIKRPAWCCRTWSNAHNVLCQSLGVLHKPRLRGEGAAPFWRPSRSPCGSTLLQKPRTWASNPVADTADGHAYMHCLGAAWSGCQAQSPTTTTAMPPPPPPRCVSAHKVQPSL